MDLGTIEVSQEEAEAGLAEYTGVLEAERTAEDAALAQAYRAVARGLPVIRLTEAIQAGGYFSNGLPRIAVVRADATECWVRFVDSWRTNRFRFVFGSDADATRRNRGGLVGRRTVRVEVDGPPAGTVTRQAYDGHTIVPLVPPRCRPKRPRLAGCHILWEVEAWDPTPPRDPALLRHLRGDLWSVLAVWDLTELERAVLAQRRS